MSKSGGKAEKGSAKDTAREDTENKSKVKGFSAIKTYDDFEEIFPEWDVQLDDKFPLTRWKDSRSVVKLNEWLELVGGKWASTHTVLGREAVNERTLYPIVFNIIKDALLFQASVTLTIGEVSFGSTSSDEGLAKAAVTGVVGFKQNKSRRTSLRSTAGTASASGHQDTLDLRNIEEVVQLYCEIEKQMKGVNVNGYAAFVISESSNRVGKAGQSRLVVEVKPSLAENAGFYQLCAELAHRFEAKNATGADVFGMLTDTKDFQYFRATRTASGFEIHHSPSYTFRAANHLDEDAFVVLGYLFEILDIDENINIKASHDAIHVKEEAMKEGMMTRARKHAALSEK